MSTTKILLAEDDTNLGDIVKEVLLARGYEVKLCRDGDEASRAFKAGQFDLVLLDIMMPKKDGFTLATEIRAKDQKTPIIFLTAREMAADKIKGFQLGGDDYITKPFGMEELELRVEAILRRTKNSDSSKQTFEFGKYKFNFDKHTLVHGKKEWSLTTKESELLRLLAIHKNNVLEREVALKAIWGDDNYFVARSMDVFVTKLRKYFKEDPTVQIINIHGIGFKLLVD